MSALAAAAEQGTTWADVGMAAVLFLGMALLLWAFGRWL